MKQIKVPIFNIEEFLSKDQTLSEARKASNDFYIENEKEKTEERIKQKYEKSFNSFSS